MRGGNARVPILHRQTGVLSKINARGFFRQRLESAGTGSNIGPDPHRRRRTRPGCARANEWSDRMRVGVPKEIKSDEYRVALMPVGAETLTKAGHEVLVEAHAGVGS